MSQLHLGNNFMNSDFRPQEIVSVDTAAFKMLSNFRI